MLNRFWTWFKSGSWRLVLQWFLVKTGLIKKPELISRSVAQHPSPEDVALGEIVIVGNANYKKWVCFRCPSNCGELILLSLNQHQHPSWRVTCDWLSRPTLNPSIRQLNDCKCHFWIKQGQTYWCQDSQHKRKLAKEARCPRS